MQKAETLRQTELTLGSSFCFETVLSMPDKVDFIRQAKWQSYTVRVYYVTTDDPQINIERVKSRVAQGGHDVPADKILSRYKRSMDLMFKVACEADEVFFFDNSGERPRFVAGKSKAIYAEENPPAWLETYLLSKARENNIPIYQFKKYE